ncbi:DUF3617 domain-containing protein [Limnobacter sp.]|uniref:DUF3617 domain-containing protein n=1 Tax=Limnobacter sp. TaxID=2003368 RepID=UPI0027B993B6|nr:DUF3617 domain-containing protein [Limnobacter sp.]
MKKILGAVLFVLSAQFAFAAEVKPGLWEMEFDAQGMGPEAQAAMKQMESMPPAQRKQMEAMMAQMGVSMGAKAGSVRFCITPEQAKANDVPVQDDGDCKNKVLSRSEKSMKVEFKCPDTQGTATVSFLSPTLYETKIDAKTTEGGQQRNIQQTLKSKWVKASCGG